MENIINTLGPIAKYVALIFLILTFLTAVIHNKFASSKVKIFMIIFICIAIVALMILTFCMIKR